MGLETAIIAAAAVGAAGQAYGQVKAADASKQALALQSKQQQLKHAQETLSNYDLLEKVLDKQTAQATTRGVALNSLSLDAVRRDTINTSFKKQSNIDTENELIQRNIKAEKSNVNATLFSQLFGDATNFGMSFASLLGKMPTKG